MLKKWLKKRKKLRLKRLRMEKNELKYADLLVQFQDINLTLAKIEFDEHYRRRSLQNYQAFDAVLLLNRLFINATGFPSQLGQYQNLPMTILLVLSSLHLPPHFRQRCALISFHSFAVFILFSPLLVRNSG
jgi:hypothetical protein